MSQDDLACTLPIGNQIFTIMRLNMNIDFKKLLPVNRLLIIIVFLLLTSAAMEFIYLYIHSVKSAPNYTGTVSDILIATTNIILSLCAIFAFKNISGLFKDKISDRAISKIDTALMSLDECIEKLSSLYFNIEIAIVYKNGNNHKAPHLTKQLNDASDNLNGALDASYRAKSTFGSLTRWNIRLESEHGKRKDKLVSDAFELCMLSTTMYAALIKEINPNSLSISTETFDELYTKFKEERLRLEDESNDLKNVSISQIFTIK